MKKIDRQRIDDIKQRVATFENATPGVVPSDEVHQCLNCGYEYQGRYCPMCGQAAATKRFTIRNIFTDFVEQGVHFSIKRLPFTLKHLLLRPGKMIGEYLDGHRAGYYPPIKLLFILVFISLIVQWILPTSAPTDSHNADLNQPIEYMNYIAEHYKAYFLISVQLVATMGTWIMFRKSPKRQRTTIPENFVLQLYMAGIDQVFEIVFLLLFGTTTLPYQIQTWITAPYYVIAFKQLFGYGWWGTIWRSVATAIIAITSLGLLGIVFAVIFILIKGQGSI